MKHIISTLLLVTGISATCIVAAQITANATSSTGADLSPTGANITNNINPNTLTSAQIMQIQQTLRSDGFSVNVDGVWGPQMTTALGQFQTAHGMMSSGTLTAQTATDLGINAGVNAGVNAPVGSANFGSSTNANLSNTTGENQIQGSGATGLNSTVSPAAGSGTTAGLGPTSTLPVSPTGAGNTIHGGVGGATGAAGTGGTSGGIGGSIGGAAGATGAAGTGGASGAASGSAGGSAGGH